MHLNQLVFQVLFGGLLMLFGLVPGLFHRFMNAAQELRQFPSVPRAAAQPTWLAGAGALIITASILIFLS